MGICICRCMRIPYMVLLGPSQGPIIGVVNFLIACSRAAHFAFLIACFLRASLHTDGFFKIFMAAGFFKIFVADGFFVLLLRVCEVGPKIPRVTCTAQDMSPELSLEHVCLLVCVFVCVFV